jgi:hypothetical protein
MLPTSESNAYLRWCGHEELASEGGTNEAQQFVFKINSTEASGAADDVKLEYDPSGSFRVTGSLAALEEKLDASDPGWPEDGRYFIEVDPVRASLPGPRPENFSQTFSRNAQT